MDTVSFIERLQRQLAHYGLNPREWQITYAGGVTFRISGLRDSDQETEFLGRACPVNGEWVQLRLKNI